MDGANIAIVAKTTEPHPTLPGTIYTAADELKEAGVLHRFWSRGMCVFTHLFIL